ncbi:hypothetical protein [Leuconostoc pseudomesenteroides]|uniref:hypothetical protein n=1 Tax=Leuconostoc pseudomesenteroides TaxID=33968 RepID=UPI002286C282|nr:hypothetical protein [Leuconostoc pseudomesenteroides]WAM37871.1 hypothetical protein OYT93_06590 [Leuconostoc pseudomesenteroides]
MATTTITFLNGDTIRLNESSILGFVGHFGQSDDDSIYISESVQYSGPVTFDDYHIKLGLAPQLTEHFHNSDYFFLHLHPDVLYSTNAIFKIESSLD